MTPELAAVIGAVVLMGGITWWARAPVAEMLLPLGIGVAVAVGTYFEVVGPLAAYLYAGATLAWVVWVLIPDDEDGEEPLASRLVGIVYRAPGYWLAGLFGGFLIVIVGALAVFIVVGIPVGLIDILSNDCDLGWIVGGCSTDNDREVTTFLDGAGFDVAAAIFAGIVAVAAILVAFGLPGHFFGSDDDDEPPTGRFATVGWVGFGLWCLALVGGVGVIFASWIQSDEFTGDYAFDPTPENRHGVPSHEFERADLERAANASDELREYCSGAVSEAQYVGCLSHADESDIP